MLLPVSRFAAEGSGIQALGIDGKAFVIQLITFVLAYLVLRRYAFGPIIKVMNQRREIIESGVKLGEQMRREKAALESNVSQALSEARKKADNIVADAEGAARDRVRAAEEEAQTKAAIIVEEGKVRGEQEVTRARRALESDLANLVADATEAIIDEKVDVKKDAQLIDRALQESRV